MDAVGEGLEPFVDCPPGEGNGENDGEVEEEDEFAAEIVQASRLEEVCGCGWK